MSDTLLVVAHSHFLFPLRLEHQWRPNDGMNQGTFSCGDATIWIDLRGKVAQMQTPEVRGTLKKRKKKNRLKRDREDSIDVEDVV